MSAKYLDNESTAWDAVEALAEAERRAGGTPKPYASLADARSAFRRVAIAFHPDKVRTRGDVDTREAGELLATAGQAIEILQRYMGSWPVRPDGGRRAVPAEVPQPWSYPPRSAGPADRHGPFDGFMGGFRGHVTNSHRSSRGATSFLFEVTSAVPLEVFERLIGTPDADMIGSVMEQFGVGKQMLLQFMDLLFGSRPADTVVVDLISSEMREAEYEPDPTSLPLFRSAADSWREAQIRDSERRAPRPASVIVERVPHARVTPYTQSASPSSPVPPSTPPRTPVAASAPPPVVGGPNPGIRTGYRFLVTPDELMQFCRTTGNGQVPGHIYGRSKGPNGQVSVPGQFLAWMSGSTFLVQGTPHEIDTSESPR